MSDNNKTFMMSSVERGMLKVIQQKYAKGNMPKTKVQPFTIRKEKALQSSDTMFQYDFKTNSNTTKRENGLSDNDCFVLLSVAVGIIKVDTTLTGNFDRGGNSQIFYYPDKNFFNDPATAVNVSEADALRAIYNGYMTIKSNTEEVLFSMLTDRFLKAPRTQFASTTDPNFEGEQYQEVPMPIIFEGQKTNDFALFFSPQADTVQINGTLGQEGFQNRLVILHRGLIIRNASEPAILAQMRMEGLAI